MRSSQPIIVLPCGPVLTMMRVMCDEGGIAAAAEAVRAGRIVAYPTDTVYGVGCDPHNTAAVAAVRAAKSREDSKPMPVLCASADSAWEIAKPDARARRLADAFWPGALTMVLPLADPGLRDTLGLRGDTVGVRVPDSPCALRLLAACGPLVGTSANVSGNTPATGADGIALDGIEVLVDGGVIDGAHRPSTIVELTGDPVIIREGALGAAELEAHWT